MNLSKRQVEDLKFLGYFQDSPTSDFVCGLVGCESRIKSSSSGGFLFVSSATNTVSISPIPSFSELTDYVLEFQRKNAGDEYFSKRTWNTEESVMCSTYVFAKSKKQSSRKVSDNLVRVKSSNVWSYGFDIQLGKNTGDLYVQFKGKSGGPGDVYEYFDFPVREWKKFITAPSKGHFFWKYVRNKYRYRKLTGDKRGKLPNAIN